MAILRRQPRWASGTKPTTIARFRYSKSFTIFASFVAIATGIGALWLLLVPATALVGGPVIHQIADPSQRVAAENSVRQTILAAVGGSIALLGFAFTARTYYLARRGQVTDRFTKAITSLNSVNQGERIGAIYSLEHLLRESPSDHDTVVEVLSAYIRERASIDPANIPPVPADALVPSRQNRHLLPRPQPDIEAAIIVLGRRPSRPERSRIVLTDLDLRGSSLTKANFRYAFFTRTRLDSSYMRGIDLTGAVLANSVISGCNLQDAIMTNADLREADLQKTRMDRAKLEGTRVKVGQLTDRQLESLSGAPIVQP